MRKEVLTALAISSAVAFGVKETPKRDVVAIGECTSIILDTHLANMGLTLPLTPKGDSIIFINPTASPSLRKHELAHALQICEEGGIPFTASYLRNPQQYEQDADRRAPWVMVRSTSFK